MRKFLAVLLVATSVIGLGGCASSVDQPAKLKNEVESTQAKKGTVLASGKIIAFEGEFVDILTGDMVQRYTYDKSQTADFYLGQNVELVSELKGNRLNPVLQEDFSKRYTTMGDLILSATGTLKVKDDKQFVIDNEADRTVLTLEGSIAYPVGTKVAVDYVQIGQGLTMIAAYDEETKKTLTISQIDRAETGEMILQLLDGFGKVYQTGTTHAELRLDLASIKVGDNVICYHEGVTEGEISQLKTVMMAKATTKK